MESQPSTTLDPRQVMDVQQKLQLDARFRSGVNWFYWIAGLSLVNTIAYLAGTDFAFVIGLGAAQVIDVFSAALATEFPSSSTLIRAIGIVFDLSLAGSFFILGRLGRARKRPAIVAGAALYILDGILLLAFQDWLGAAFHAWALLGIFGGLRALGQLENLERQSGESVEALKERVPALQPKPTREAVQLRWIIVILAAVIVILCAAAYFLNL